MVTFWSPEAQRPSAEVVLDCSPNSRLCSQNLPQPHCALRHKGCSKLIPSQEIICEAEEIHLTSNCISGLLRDRCEHAVPTQVPSSLTAPTTAMKQAVTESYAAS